MSDNQRDYDACQTCVHNRIAHNSSNGSCCGLGTLTIPCDKKCEMFIFRE